MKIIKCLLTSLILFSSASTFAQESQQTQQDNLTTAYISDDLLIYMHAGPGNNYRILGSINAGDEIKLTGNVENSYTEVVDTKDRTTWIESRYVSTTPGLRVVIAELNSKLANSEESNQTASNEIERAQNEMAQLKNQTKQLNNQISTLKKQLAHSESQLSNQDMDIKKEYFFNGAIVLGLGLILGLIIPRISIRKKSSMANWK